MDTFNMFDDLTEYLEKNCYIMTRSCATRRKLSKNKDKKVRKDTYHYIYEFLNKLKNDNVNELGGYIKPLSDIYFLLGYVGYRPLDIYAHIDDVSIRIKLTSENIAKAMEAYLIPYNRKWCYCLVENELN